MVRTVRNKDDPSLLLGWRDNNCNKCLAASFRFFSFVSDGEEEKVSGTAIIVDSVTNAFDKVAKSSDALADAQQGLLSTLGGSFDILTDKQQQKVFDANVADIKRAIKAGFFDGDKIGTLKGKEVIGVGDQARAVLRASENLENAQNDLVKSNQDLAKATATLAEKKWEVNVAVNANTGESSVDLG